jgi:beta-phosphoglucomutase-like phosphatase (HAD superfamily)
MERLSSVPVPRAILFDFNGVLVDDEPLHRRLLLEVLAEEGIEVDSAWTELGFLGRDDRSCLTEAALRAGRPLPASRLARLIARKASYYGEAVRRGGYPVFPGAPAALVTLAEAGLALGVVSGALRQEVEEALAEMGVRRHLQVVVAAEDVERGKPDPEGYRRALTVLQDAGRPGDRLVHPHEVVGVEDSAAGLEAAAAAGLRTLAVVGEGAGELAAAEAAIGSVAELTAARLAELFPELDLR